MRRMLTVQFFFALCSLSLFCEAQRQYSGFFINLSSDTVHGYFKDFVIKNTTNGSAKFQSQSTGSEIVLIPANCKAFTVYIPESDTTLRFISYQGKRLINPARSISDISREADDLYSDSTIFLQKIFDNADIRVYVFSDHLRDNFFVQKGNGEILELKYKIYSVNGTDVYNDFSYRSQLVINFGPEIEKAGLKNAVDQLDYTYQDFMRFFAKLTHTKFERKKKKYPVELIAKVGTSINSFYVTGSTDGRNDAITSYDKNNSFAFSIGLNFPTQGSNGKLFFSPQIKYYTSLKHQGTYTKPDNSGKSITTFTFSNLIAPQLVIGYKFLSTPNFSVAPSIGFGALLVGKNTYNQVNYIFSTPGPLSNEYPKNQTAMYFDTEINFSFFKYGIATLSYTPKTKLTQYLGFGAQHSDIGFSIGGSVPLFR